MSNEKKVSIIMPIYNTGIYLNEALDCLINQTLKEIEIICVNDASDDELTLEILHRYESYNIIKIINLEKNVGAGEARNIGIQKSNGEYLMFLDSDDLFELDFAEIMYKCISENQADICVSYYDRFSIENGKKCIYDGCFPSLCLVERNELGWLKNDTTMVWHKIFRRKFIVENNICFQDIVAANDNYFSLITMLRADKVVIYSDKALVHYREKRNGQISSVRTWLHVFEAGKYTLNKAKDESEKIELFLSLLWRFQAYWYDDVDEAQKVKIYKCMRELINEYRLSVVEFLGKYRYLIEMYDNVNYDDDWMRIALNYYELKNNLGDIKRKLKNTEKIGLWGIGRRGKAFIKLCKEENINVYAITDSNYDMCISFQGTDYKIMRKEEFINEVSDVIASNYIVKDMLATYGINPVLDLEDYHIDLGG